MSKLHLTQAVYDAIRTHGEDTYPYECCGALLGVLGVDGWQVTVSIRAGNAREDSAHTRYSIAPLELVRIEQEARQKGLEIAGFYHSHPNHPAQWSQTDYAEAHWLGCAYVITAVAAGKAETTNAFLLDGAREEEKQFVQLVVHVSG